MKLQLWATVFLVCLTSLHIRKANGVTCENRKSWCENFKHLCDIVVSMQKDCRRSCGKCGDNCDPNAMGCEYECATTASGPVCTCPKGLTLHANHKSCIDIDECLGENPCPADRPVCLNQEGSYLCKENPLCHLQPDTTTYYNSTTCCTKTQPQSTCGQNAATETLSNGGVDAILSLWPWTVFVSSADRFCTGVLIADEWVVAPAHCFSDGTDAAAGPFRATLGMRTTSQRNVSIEVAVTQVHIHPSYDYPNSDIALLRLGRPLAFTRFVRPICLPGGELPEEGASCFLSGYETEFYEMGLRRTMNEAGMFRVTNSNCRKNLKSPGRQIDEHTLCAKHDQSAISSCPGESGGPLVCQRCNSCDWYLAGISSYGGACPETESFGMFTSVESYEHWIIAITNMTSSSNYACHNAGTAWRPWGTWSACSRTCGDGLRSRTRDCNGGVSGSSQGCIGVSDDIEPCNLRDCPRWSGYSQWSSCSRSCGNGRQTRQRFCENGLVGEAGCKGRATDYRTCNLRACGWSRWGSWGACNATCGRDVQRMRKRVCRSGAGRCPGSAVSTTSCNYADCPGEWSSWSTWSTCSKTCGSGMRVSGRKCVDGNRCRGLGSRTEACNSVACPEPCADKTNTKTLGTLCTEDPEWCDRYPGFMFRSCGKTCCLYGALDGYSDWSNWSACSETCGKGVITRTRDCVDPNGCSHTTVPTKITKQCPQVSCFRLSRSYTPWGECSVTCGGGTQQRQSSVCIENNNCTTTNEERSCGNQTCPPRWLLWEPWTDCSVTCGEGSRTRSRVCENETANDGCVGESVETEPCSEEACVGTWEEWDEWSNCSVSCGDGTRTRQRQCATGDNCVGEESETESCNQGTCPPPCENDPDWDTVCDFLTSLCYQQDVANTCRKTCSLC